MAYLYQISVVSTRNYARLLSREGKTDYFQVRIATNKKDNNPNPKLKHND